MKKCEEQQKQLTSKSAEVHYRVTDLETKINSQEINLEEFISAQDAESDNTELIAKKQIEIAGLETEAMEVREECAVSEIDLKRVKQDLIHRRHNIQRKKTALVRMTHFKLISLLMTLKDSVIYN